MSRAAGDHGDAFPSGVERALVGRRVDARRAARDDAKPRLRERTGEALGLRPSIVAGAARTYNRDAFACRKFSAQKEDRRGVVEWDEQRRIAGIA